MLKKINYILWMVIPVLLAGICMILVVVNYNQAYMPIPCELNFSREKPWIVKETNPLCIQRQYFGVVFFLQVGAGGVFCTNFELLSHITRYDTFQHWFLGFNMLCSHLLAEGRGVQEGQAYCFMCGLLCAYCSVQVYELFWTCLISEFFFFF